jgi:two-component system, NtrC family, sensor kinase
MTWRPEPPCGDPQRELKLICMNNLLATTEVRLYFKDLLSRFILVSAGWVAAYAPGRSAADLIGKTDFDVFSYTHANAAFTDEQQIIRTGLPIIAKLERETYKGRADAWVSTTKMPLRDERGKIIGTFGFSRDVTSYIAAGQAVGKP